MKKFGIIALALLLILLPSMLFAQAKPIVLRLAETHPKGYPTEMGDEEFARLVKERSNGRIIVEVYPGSQLGEEKAVIEQVQFGAIDMTRVSISPVAAFVPKLNAFQMPYLYRDSDHMWKVLKGNIGMELLASLEPFGFIGLGWFEAGARSFYNSKKPERISRLGRKDISVLHALIKSNGHLVTRNQLLDDVWSGRIVTDNVLTVSISNIRKALKLIHPVGDELIVTINGIGYMMDIRASGLIVYCEKE